MNRFFIFQCLLDEDKYKSNKWKNVVWHYIIDTTRVNCRMLLLVTNPDVYGLDKHPSSLGSSLPKA